MKKITYVIISVIVLFLASCTDDSGEYSQKLFSNSDISEALRQCLICCSDSANYHLSVPDTTAFGYYNYEDGKYRITLSAAAFIFDTLRNNEHGDLVDMFIYQINNSASGISIEMSDYFKSVRSDIKFEDPSAILYGSQKALTNYFEKNYSFPFITTISSTLSSYFTKQEIYTLWNELLSIYANYSSQPVNIDLQWQIAQQMVDGFIKEMGIEEVNVRTLVSHRGATNTTLYRVFATLDPPQ